MHGPGPLSETNKLGWAPSYTQPIRITDTLVTTLGPLRRIIWRRARDKGLAKWNAAGITFGMVEELEPEAYAPHGIYDGSLGSGSYLRPDEIRFVRSTRDGYAYAFAYWLATVGGGAVFLRPTAVWWRDDGDRYVRSLAGVVGHEIGHTLGLWHRSDSGIMAGAWNPDEHDLESVRSFYE